MGIGVADCGDDGVALRCGGRALGGWVAGWEDAALGNLVVADAVLEEWLSWWGGGVVLVHGCFHEDRPYPRLRAHEDVDWRVRLLLG